MGVFLLSMPASRSVLYTRPFPLKRACTKNSRRAKSGGNFMGH
jgi:hypothetical protein